MRMHRNVRLSVTHYKDNLFVETSFHNYFKHVKIANVQCDNVETIFSGGLTLPTTHLGTIDHVTAFRILNFVLRAKDCSGHIRATT